MSAGAPESSTSTKHEQPIVRSPIWFTDGNIVLQAQSVQFKFYQNLLAEYALFFKDAFEIPQPAHGADVVEGCLVVKLPESAEDVEYMLNFMLKPEPSRQTPSVANIISGLHIGQKYMIPALWNDAVARLRYEFPDRLEEYQERREIPVMPLPGYTRICVELGRASSQSLLRLVYAAQVVDLQTILPALCLQASEVCKEEDLTQVLVGGKALDSMSTHIRHCLLKGRTKTLAAKVRLIRDAFAEPQPPSQECANRDECREARRRMLNESLKTLERQETYALFYPWSERLLGSPNLAFCESCAEDTVRTLTEGQQEIWDSLPSFFKLPDWGQMEDFSVTEGE
ncbi:hypothetical protein GGG16DRAFT_52374 [Schizophyllum commune]